MPVLLSEATVTTRVKDDGTIVVTATRPNGDALRREIPPWQLGAIKRFAPDVYRFFLSNG